MSSRAKRRVAQGCSARIPLFGRSKSRLAESAKEAKDIGKTRRKVVR